MANNTPGFQQVFVDESTKALPPSVLAKASADLGIPAINSAVALRALDTAVVKLTGNQTIAGTKTYSSPVVVPTPTASGHAVTKAYADGLAGSVVDATPSVKGKIQLAGDLGGTADAPTVPGAVKTSGDQNIVGVKTFAASPVVPTPTTSTQAANKSYVDAAAASGSIADATASTAGKLRLAGDLSGTATAPTVPGLLSRAVKSAAETISGAWTFTTAPIVPAASFAVDRVVGLASALAGKADLAAGFRTWAQASPGTVGTIRKSGSTWPQRPSTRTDITFDWVGPDPAPAIVSSGTGGMYIGDGRRVTES